VGHNVLFLPWPSGSKGEKRRWKHRTLEDMSKPAYLAELETGNIGIAQGSRSNGLCSIDIDDDEEVDGFLKLNRALACSLRTKGARGCNCWFVADGEIPPCKFIETKDGRKWGECRGEGAQTIIHGKHPTGCDYQIIESGRPIFLGFRQIVWPSNVINPFIADSQCTDGTDEHRGIQKDTEKTDESHACSSVLVCAKIETIDDVVALALPGTRHTSHLHLLTLARAVKTLESNLGEPFTPDERREVFGRWYDEATPFLRADNPREEYYIEFLNCYRAAKHPIGDSDAVAWDRAVRNPLPADFLPHFQKPETRLLLGFCFELQRLSGDDPFFLSCRTAAKFLGCCTHRTAASWLSAFVVDGVLEEVTKGSEATGKASRYKFNGRLT
jgi:hypothetical protein